MKYRIYYMWKAIKCDEEIDNCENIMDALYKFYDKHGICEITIIAKV